MKENEFEEIRDEVQAKIVQARRAHLIRQGLLEPDCFTRSDLGLSAVEEVSLGRDGGYGEDIQKSLDRVGAIASKEPSWRREGKALTFLKGVMNQGFYGYLKLAKLLGVPKESFTVHVWGSLFLPKYLSLVNPGGEVTLLEGQYNIQGMVTPRGQTLLSGKGPSTLLYLVNTTNTDVIRVSGFNDAWIRDLKIDGNYANNAGPNIDGISFINAQRGKVENVIVQNARRNGIRTWSDASDIDIVNTEITACQGAQAAYLHGVGGAGHRVVNCRVHHNALDGIWQIKMVTHVISSKIDHNGGNGIYVYAESGAGFIVQSYISYNTLNGIYDEGSDTGEHSIVGNAIWWNGTVGAPRDGIRIEKGHKLTVTGNQADGNRGHGINLKGSYYCSLVGNCTADNSAGVAGYDGIHLEAFVGVNPDYNILQGNICNRIAGYNQRYGIYIGAGTGNLVDGNITSGNLTAPFLDLGTNTIRVHNRWG